ADDERVVVLHGLRLQCPALPGGVPERPKGTGCKPVGSAYGGSNPPAPIFSYAGEHLRFSPAGPSPTAFFRRVGGLVSSGVSQRVRGFGEPPAAAPALSGAAATPAVDARE